LYVNILKVSPLIFYTKLLKKNIFWLCNKFYFSLIILNDPIKELVNRIMMIMNSESSCLFIYCLKKKQKEHKSN